MSKKLAIKAGVSHGSILGPFIYLYIYIYMYIYIIYIYIYINDLSDNLDSNIMILIVSLWVDK